MKTQYEYTTADTDSSTKATDIQTPKHRYTDQRNTYSGLPVSEHPTASSPGAGDGGTIPIVLIASSQFDIKPVTLSSPNAADP